MEFSISSSAKEEMIDITGQVKRLVTGSEVEEGSCHVFVKSTTSAIIINENFDPNICTDILNTLDKLVPKNHNYLHDAVDNNAASHIKSTLLGPGKTIPVKQGKLNLGRWQSIMFVELDGPREQRQIAVQVLPD